MPGVFLVWKEKKKPWREATWQFLMSREHYVHLLCMHVQ